MAIEYFASINLNKNELQNAVIQNVASSNPGSPSTGQIFFDTDVNQIKVYYGSAWHGLVTEVEDTDHLCAATASSANVDITVNYLDQTR